MTSETKQQSIHRLQSIIVNMRRRIEDTPEWQAIQNAEAVIQALVNEPEIKSPEGSGRGKP